MRIKDILDTMDAGPVPEPADAVRAWLDAHRGRFGAFVDGAFAAPGDDGTAMSDPATGAPLATVARCSAAEVEAAVAAAARAAASWAATPGHLRARHLRALARRVEERGRFLAVLDALGSGRPVRAARDRDVPGAARCLAHHAGSADLCASAFAGRAPLGVCAAILPWHATLASLARAVAPALAAGNAVVLKPAGETPLLALAFAELCTEAGLPPGVVGVVPGDDGTGAALARHPGVAALDFAGSDRAARAIRAATAGDGTALDLRPDGGPERVLVFADADLDAAMEGVVDAAWSGGGPSGRAGARILVQEGVAGRFVAKLRRRMGHLRTGDPLDGATDVGPALDADRLRRLRDFVAAAEAEGAEAVCADAPPPAAGLFVPPTLLLGVEPGSASAEVPFCGPVATLATFRTPAEAVALAGDARSGASIWSQDVDLALDMAMRVRTRRAWINAAEPEEAPALDGLAELERWFAPAPVARVAVSRAATLRAPAPSGAGTDVETAVAAAGRAGAWGAASALDRARRLSGAAQALSARARDVAERLSAVVGADGVAREVEAAVRRASFYAAGAGRREGRVGVPGTRRLALAIEEPHGVMGLVCPDEAPLLALVSLLLPALAMGNRAVVVPSAVCPSAAVELVRAFEAGGLPAGTVAVAPGGGDRLAIASLAEALAGHGGVAALWHHGPAEEAAAVERTAAGALKPVWCDDGSSRDWFDDATAQGDAFLRRAARTRTVWVPYGE